MIGLDPIQFLNPLRTEPGVMSPLVRSPSHDERYKRFIILDFSIHQIGDEYCVGVTLLYTTLCALFLTRPFFAECTYNVFKLQKKILFDTFKYGYLLCVHVSPFAHPPYCFDDLEEFYCILQYLTVSYGIFGILWYLMVSYGILRHLMVSYGI